MRSLIMNTTVSRTKATALIKKKKNAVVVICHI